MSGAGPSVLAGEKVYLDDDGFAPCYRNFAEETERLSRILAVSAGGQRIKDRPIGLIRDFPEIQRKVNVQGARVGF
jgi:hypothetical protein